MNREPLTWRGLAVLVLAAVAQLLTEFGITMSAGLQDAIVGLVAAAGLVYLVVTGRREITPIEDPRDEDGAQLVRADGKPLKRANVTQRS